MTVILETKKLSRNSNWVNIFFQFSEVFFLIKNKLSLFDIGPECYSVLLGALNLGYDQKRRFTVKRPSIHPHVFTNGSSQAKSTLVTIPQTGVGAGSPWSRGQQRFPHRENLQFHQQQFKQFRQVQCCVCVCVCVCVCTDIQTYKQICLFIFHLSWLFLGSETNLSCAHCSLIFEMVSDQKKIGADQIGNERFTRQTRMKDSPGAEL